MMNTSDFSSISDQVAPVPLGPAIGGLRKLHRLYEVRVRERVSRRNVGRQLGMTEAQVRDQEMENVDLPLSLLRKWAQALDVPVAELVQEPGVSLSLPLLRRAQLVRMMKTVRAMLERAADDQSRRLADMLVAQLLELMPELDDVKAWNAVGSRRSSNEMGWAFTHQVSVRDFGDSLDEP